jgi:hypothetical protein
MLETRLRSDAGDEAEVRCRRREPLRSDAGREPLRSDAGDESRSGQMQGKLRLRCSSVRNEDREGIGHIDLVHNPELDSLHAPLLCDPVMPGCGI